MEITDIKIRKTFEEGPLRAIMSVTFDDSLALHDVKIINADSRQFVVMPSRKNADGTYKDIVHPINSDFRRKLEEKLLSAYNTHLIETHDDGVIEFQLT
ncbi:MAG: SpoVG family protein [Clostridia bacterium]|nr:SpoVG family protein [Clostridia bacterium]